MEIIRCTVLDKSGIEIWASITMRFREGVVTDLHGLSPRSTLGLATGEKPKDVQALQRAVWSSCAAFAAAAGC